jgi:excisionase family DNA binding protein
MPTTNRDTVPAVTAPLPGAADPALLYTRDGLPLALLTDRQAAIVAGCGRTTIREEIAAGRIMARKLGKALRIEASSLMAWINSRPVARLRPDVRSKPRPQRAA